VRAPQQPPKVSLAFTGQQKGEIGGCSRPKPCQGQLALDEVLRQILGLNSEAPGRLWPTPRTFSQSGSAWTFMGLPLRAIAPRAQASQLLGPIPGVSACPRGLSDHPGRGGCVGGHLAVPGQPKAT